MVSMLCFGITLFLNGYANDLFPQAYVYVCVLNSCQALIGLIGHVLSRFFEDTEYHKQCETAKAFGMRTTIVCFLLPGFAAVSANYNVQMSYKEDPCNAGVNNAIVT